MSMDRSAIEGRRGSAFAQSRSLVLYAFASTLFVSAMLLFSVQPMFAKMVVPKLGGAPAVWAVAMCFFQAMLLLGYCYAHLLTRFAGAKWAALVHLCICATAFWFLPISLPQGWEEPPAQFTQIWLLGLFAVSVGWPFFAVSANAPLLQAWFSRTGHPHASDPYFLYGASNIGSMVALLGYPVIIEPAIGLSSQGSVWAGGFCLLVAMIAGCAWLMSLNASSADAAGAEVTSRPQAAARISWQDRLIWIALAFVPSGLLVAFTTHISTDIASAPFLWIGPLALYLLTYILVFRDPPHVSMPMLLKVQPVLVLGALLSLAGSGVVFWLIGVVCGTGAFFTTALIFHRILYERRPAAEQLTEFYLWMSFGGVLGGIFTALIAPVIFTLVIEYPLLLLLGLLRGREVLESRLVKSVRRNAVLVAATGGLAVALAMLVLNWTSPGGASTLIAGSFALFAALSVAALKGGERLFSAICAVLAVIILLPHDYVSAHTERSFFGVHRVLLSDDGSFRLLQHGTTLHGGQRLVDADGKSLEGVRPVPGTYYYPQGPMASLAELTRQIMPAGSTLRGGVVGLGSGAFACNTRDGEQWRFYEIDPVVAKIARDPAHFTYMSACQPGAPVIIGDARLTVAREPEASFDYLLIDAFSSDSIPVHLLTREAVEMFQSRVTNDGVLVMHISNRYLDLATVLEAAVAGMDGVHGIVISDLEPKSGLDSAGSMVVAISRSAETLDRVTGFTSIRKMEQATVSPWTDDYSNIVAALLRNFMKQYK